MNIVFFGTSDFAIPSLRELLSSRHRVSAVVTQPDRKKGRALRVSVPPTKALAVSRGIAVYQPADVSGDESVEYLKRWNADLFVVVSFGQILKKEALSIPRLYSINLHGSLLPKYRGAAPTNWAMINGDAFTGATTIRMNEGMDAGDIILKKEIPIDKEDTNITLSEKLSELGAKLLLETIDLIEDEKIEFEKQDERQATYAPKMKKEDGLIDWNESAPAIHNKVRGLIPWPGAYTYSKGKILKIWKTELTDKQTHVGVKAGEVLGIIRDKGIIVHTGSGSLAVQYLQVEGKKILDAGSFVRGHRIISGHVFGK